MSDPSKLQYIDLSLAVQHLSEAIQFKTISYPDYETTDFKVYKDFLDWLGNSYPAIERVCRKEMASEYCPVYIWEGRGDAANKPILLLGHYDVVPVDETAWEEPPFAGTIKDDFVWGRGALDDKHQVIAVMEVVEFLINSGVTPDRDIYMAFGFDEEINGRRGAEKIAEVFATRGLQFECVIDEGGCIVTDMMPGLDVPAALIGVAEKASSNIMISVAGQGGHSSMPPQHTAIGLLAQIIANVENHPMPPRLTAPVAEMFKRMAPHMGGKKILLQNIERLFPLINSTLAKSQSVNAMIRTTIAFTMTDGGYAPNVLPPRARAVANLRVLQGDTVAETIAHIRKVNPGIDFDIEELTVEDPAQASPLDSAPFQAIERIINDLYPEALVMPYLMAGATDSRKYAQLCSNIYRFAAVVLTSADYATIHSNNERISFANLARMLEFYRRFLMRYMG